MVGFTAENRPICHKCKDEIALTLYQDLWLCGKCMRTHIQKNIKAKQEMILNG